MTIAYVTGPKPHREGPYLIDRVSSHGSSVWLKVMSSGTIKGKYHVNDTQVYTERKVSKVDSEN